MTEWKLLTRQPSPLSVLVVSQWELLYIRLQARLVSMVSRARPLLTANSGMQPAFVKVNYSA
jgi:hypothetical protein